MKYTLKVGTVYGPNDEWGGSVSSTGLLFNNIEDVEKVIELAHPPAWIICSIEDGEVGWHDTEVKMSPVVEQTRKKYADEKLKHETAMNEKVNEINKQPTVVTCKFGISLEVNIHRDQATFDPIHSSSVVTPIRCELSDSGKVVIKHFWPDEFISKNGRVLGKKLYRQYAHYKELNGGDLGMLADELTNVLMLIERLRQGTYKFTSGKYLLRVIQEVHPLEVV